MSADIPRWMMQDPARVYERIEGMQRAQDKRDKRGRNKHALEELKKLFEDAKTKEQDHD